MGALRPNVGNGEDIGTALRRLAELGQRTTNVPIDLAVEELPRVGDTVEREIVAIAQEALTNAVRHSRARRITIRASTAQSVGFDCPSPTTAAGSPATPRLQGLA